MNAAPELLEAAAQGDEQACEQMLRENSGLIWSIVRRYYGRGVEPGRPLSARMPWIHQSNKGI